MTTKDLQKIEAMLDKKIDHAVGLVMEVTNSKFEIIRESINTTNKKLDRFEKRTEERFDQLESDVVDIKFEMGDLKQDVKLIKQALIVRDILEDPESHE